MKKNKIKTKKLLKILGIILGVVAILFLISKIYCFVVFTKVYEAVENFRLEENRYYAVEVIQKENLTHKEEIFLKQNIFKFLELEDDFHLYCEWKDIYTNEQYVMNIDEKKAFQEGLPECKERSLPNIPDVLLLKQNNIQSKIAKTFEIRYILLAKYEDKKCYKIVTDTEIIMIDRKTYLPVYLSTKLNNKKDKIEMKYQFEVGNVTDEDVALPNLTDYTVVNIEENK